MKPTGRLVVYGSLGLRRGISDLLWAYRKANRMEEFPAYLDDHPFQVMDRIRADRANGMKTADVVLMPHYAIMAMESEKLLDSVRPPIEGIPKNMRSSGKSVPIGATFMAMAYDSKALKAGDIPDSLEDVAGKEWRGRLGAQSLTSSKSGNLGAWYLSCLRTSAAKSHWGSFLESISGPNRPKTYDCIDHLLQGLLEGDVALALTVYSLAYFREKTQGASVRLVPSSRIPHMMTFTSAGIVSGSEQPDSAKRFIDFLVSPQGQRIVGEIPGIAPVRRGVPASYDFEHTINSKTGFFPQPDDVKAAEESVRLFRKLGLP